MSPRAPTPGSPSNRGRPGDRGPDVRAGRTRADSVLGCARREHASLGHPLGTRLLKEPELQDRASAHSCHGDPRIPRGRAVTLSLALLRPHPGPHALSDRSTCPVPARLFQTARRSLRAEGERRSTRAKTGLPGSPRERGQRLSRCPVCWRLGTFLNVCFGLTAGAGKRLLAPPDNSRQGHSVSQHLGKRRLGRASNRRALQRPGVATQSQKTACGCDGEEGRSHTEAPGEAGPDGFAEHGRLPAPARGSTPARDLPRPPGAGTITAPAGQTGNEEAAGSDLLV